jgi:hypothetical protein
MFTKLTDVIDLFRKGSEVANKEKWKDAGNIVPLLTAAIMAAVKLAGDYGYGIQLSVEEATGVATGVASVFLFVVHNITSKSAGILPAKQLQGVVPEARAEAPAALTNEAPLVQPSVDDATRIKAAQYVREHADTTYIG